MAHRAAGIDDVGHVAVAFVRARAPAAARRARRSRATGPPDRAAARRSSTGASAPRRGSRGPSPSPSRSESRSCPSERTPTGTSARARASTRSRSGCCRTAEGRCSRRRAATPSRSRSPILRGKSAIPLFWTQRPFSVFTLKCRKSVVSHELRQHAEAVVGRVRGVVDDPPVGVREAHEPRVLDAPALVLAHRKDHPLRELAVGARSRARSSSERARACAPSYR